MQTDQALLTSLIRLAAAFPRDRVRESTLTLYASKLAGHDLGKIQAVIEEAIVGSASFPSLNELRTTYLHKQQREQAYALTEGRGIPMPKEVKDAIAPALLMMDKRAEELNEGAAS